jgi:hypothetical protein
MFCFIDVGFIKEVVRPAPNFMKNIFYVENKDPQNTFRNKTHTHASINIIKEAWFP